MLKDKGLLKKRTTHQAQVDPRELPIPETARY